MLLIEAAEAGNEKEVEECAVVFTEHAAKLEEVREKCYILININRIVKKVRTCIVLLEFAVVSLRATFLQWLLPKSCKHSKTLISFL